MTLSFILWFTLPACDTGWMFGIITIRSKNWYYSSIGEQKMQAPNQIQDTQSLERASEKSGSIGKQRHVLVLLLTACFVVFHFTRVQFAITLIKMVSKGDRSCCYKMLYIDHLFHSYNPCAVVTIVILSRQQLPLPYLMNSEPCEGTNTTTSS